MLGIILEAQGRAADAQRMYERALEIDPRAPVAANNLAWMYANNGANLDIALQLAQAAKQKLPDEAEVNDTLGWVYYKKNMAEQAVTAFEQSARHSPKNAEFQFHLGLAQAKAGNASGARTALTAALKLNPAFQGADEARRILSQP
jgi:Flp pilus assembly protein TadD